MLHSSTRHRRRTFFDTANTYGPRTVNRLIADALRPLPPGGDRRHQGRRRARPAHGPQRKAAAERPPGRLAPRVLSSRLEHAPELPLLSQSAR